MTATNDVKARWVAQMNVCATLLLKAIEWLKDRNLRVFAALCPPNLDNCPLTATGNELLKSYGALRTFMQNNPTFGKVLSNQAIGIFV